MSHFYWDFTKHLQHNSNWQIKKFAGSFWQFVADRLCNESKRYKLFFGEKFQPVRIPRFLPVRIALLAITGPRTRAKPAVVGPVHRRVGRHPWTTSRTDIFHERGNLHELDAGAHTVEAGHPLE